MTRIVYAGYNFFSSCLSAIAQRTDTDVVLCLTGDRREAVGDIVRIAAARNTPVHFGSLTARSLRAIADLEPDLLVVAAYNFRVPIEKLSIRYAINVHPSLLPSGRGPNSLPYLVGQQGVHCGLTVHRLTPRLDEGPIIDQEPVSLLPTDGFDELALRMHVAAPRLLSRVLDNLDQLYGSAQPQVGGDYWPAHSEQDRSVKMATATIDDVKKHHRLFGTLGILLVLADGRTLSTSRLTAVAVPHGYMPGGVVAESDQGLIVACTDGVVRLHDEFSSLAP